MMRGKTFSNVATLTPVIKGAVINYSSSDKNVADVNEKGDVKINDVGKARITASFTGNDTCLASTMSYVITVEDHTLKSRWIRTRLQSLKPTDRFVIVDVSAKRAMSNKEVTQQAPKAVPITTDEENSELTCDVADSLVWNVSCNKMRYTFYPDGQTVNHLYSNSYGKNDCLRISSLDHDLSFPFCEKNGYYGLSIMYEHTYYIYVSEDKKFWKAYKTIPDPITSIAYYKRYAVDENGKVPTTIAFDKGDTIIYEKCTVGTMAEYTNKARVLTSDGHVLLTDAKVTYTVSSDNAKVADGQVNVDATKLATYTITASYVGNETFAPSTASYTITVGRVVIDQTKDKKTFSAGNDVTVTVKRTFNDNAWNTLVLPFDLTEEQIKEAFGKDVVVATYTGVTRNADNTFTLNFTETKTIIANVPVFIYGVQAREEGYTFTGGTLRTLCRHRPLTDSTSLALTSAHRCRLVTTLLIPRTSSTGPVITRLLSMAHVQPLSQQAMFQKPKDLVSTSEMTARRQTSIPFVLNVYQYQQRLYSIFLDSVSGKRIKVLSLGIERLI